MSNEKMDFKTGLTALIRERETGDHPEVDVLIAYHQGELTGGQRDGVLDHLTVCRQCMGMLRDFREFSDSVAERAEEESVDFEAAASLRALKPRLAATDGAAEPDTAGRSPSPSVPKKSVWQVLAAMAATFVLTALGFSIWNSEQQRTPAGLQPNAAIYDLKEQSGERSGRTAPVTSIPASLGATLILSPDLEPPFTKYRIVFRDVGGAVIQSAQGLTPHPVDATLTCGLLPGSLPPGDYGVELYEDVPNAPVRPLAEYSIRVLEPLPGSE